MPPQNDAALALLRPPRPPTPTRYLRAVAKSRTAFLCRSCGGVQHRWMGKCPDCGVWDALEPQTIEAAAVRDPQRGVAERFALASAALAEGEPLAEQGPIPALADAPQAVPLASPADHAAPVRRLPTGIAEFDRVLGGGFAPGSAVLLGGDPGIGKSTLLLQALRAMASRGERVLYVSSEESADQVRLRAQRLGDEGRPATDDNLWILADTNLARIVEQIGRVLPAAVVIDSIQMIYKADLPASPGSVAQLRRCCTELVYLAKISGVAIVLVGHVTKDGAIAGPRLLEHLVDAVLSFEGDRHHAHRVVRAAKNRFGTTLEIGLFEMTGAGLREVPEGAGVAAALHDSPRPGSVVCPVVSGTRCLLTEVQALTATGFLGAAKRKSSGLDPSRLAMLIAVLEQHAGLRLADRDVFASAVGGVRVVEPAADLALLLAIAGAHFRRALAPATAVVGEVGLGGEIRPVAHFEQRLRESARLGYTRVLAPKSPAARALRSVEVVQCATIAAAIEDLG